MKSKSSKKHSPPEQNTLWTPGRVVITALTLCLLAAVGVSSCHSGDETTRVKPAGPTNPSTNPATNRAQPPTGASTASASLPDGVREESMPTVNGSSIKLANYSGKVLFVNLWATWCGPCRLETPELVRLHKEYRGKGLTMVGLSTENPDASADLVRNFVRDFNVDYQIGWATPTVAMGFMQLTGRNAIPQSFIIGPDGRVLNRFVGFNPATTPDQLKQAIEAALSNTAD
jgi:thiol-disulfide isomerase/thioredoxin